MSKEEKKPLLSGTGDLKYSSNEQTIIPSDEVRLTVLPQRNPEFLLGSLKDRESPPGTIRNKITYTWNDICVFANEKRGRKSKFLGNLSAINSPTGNSQRKDILKNVCGVAYPGELLAILGSSGAGKTTLLNALNFRSSTNTTVTGLRCMNGVPVNRSVLTNQSAYVQQDDLFIGCLTVTEHLQFQALVRMDKHIPYKQRMQRVEEVITELGLGKCRSTQAGDPGRNKGLSGGERKRLSFAGELLTDPVLMFCDEPTSGLDSCMARHVLHVLKRLAAAGRTVLCTIHQPSSELYGMFDRLLLMAEGRVAFHGTPDQADLFFTSLDAPCPHNYNPADYYVQLLAVVPSREESCRQAVHSVCNSFQASELGKQLELESGTLAQQEWSYSDFFTDSSGGATTPYKASWCHQFSAVLWRSWLSVIKEPMLVKVRFLQTIMVALILGIIYYGQKFDETGVMNINGALFIFLTNMTFQNVFAVINVFCAELPIFLREHRNGMYRVDVYFLSKTLAELPLFVAIPTIFTSISYYMIGFNAEMPRFFIAVAVITLVANVATSFGYLISCASSSVSMALSVGPPVIIPFLLFGGFFLNTGSVPIYFQWLSFLSWFRYGNEALLINQWQGVENIECSNSNATCPSSGHVVLESLNFSEGNFTLDLLSLVALIVGFRFIGFLSLLVKTYRRE